MQIFHLGTQSGTLSLNISLFKFRTHKSIQFTKYKSKSHLEYRRTFKKTALWFYLNFKGLGFLINTIQHSIDALNCTTIFKHSFKSI